MILGQNLESWVCFQETKHKETVVKIFMREGMCVMLSVLADANSF